MGSHREGKEGDETGLRERGDEEWAATGRKQGGAERKEKRGDTGTEEREKKRAATRTKEEEEEGGDRVGRVGGEAGCHKDNRGRRRRRNVSLHAIEMLSHACVLAFKAIQNTCQERNQTPGGNHML